MIERRPSPEFDQARFEEAKLKLSREINRSDFDHIKSPSLKDPQRQLSRQEVFMTALELINLYGLGLSLKEVEDRFSEAVVKKRDQDDFHRQLFLDKVSYLYVFFHEETMVSSENIRKAKNFFSTDDWLWRHRPVLKTQTLPFYKDGLNKECFNEACVLAKDIIEG